MVIFPVILNDPNYPKPPYFRHFVSPFVPL